MVEGPLAKLARLLGGVALSYGSLGHQVLGQLITLNSREVELGAAATLIQAVDEPTLFGFQFGTDGTGADTLLVNKGGARQPEQAIRPRHRHRWESALYMDGPSLMSFTVAAVPEVIDDILRLAELRREDIDLYLMHQATLKMLQQLQQRLGLNDDKLPICLEECGNTVSSTIPILIAQLRAQQRLPLDRHHLVIGFGVGWSWAGCVWTPGGLK